MSDDGAKCFCGRPARHAGRHVGVKNAPRAPRADRVQHILADEIELAAAKANDLRAQARRINDELATVTARLQALREAQAFCTPKPEKVAPVAEPPRVFTKTAAKPNPFAPRETNVAVQPLAIDLPEPVHVLESDNPADWEPIATNLAEVARWAAGQHIAFKDWDDLPRVNRARETVGVPLFKRPLNGRPFGSQALR